MGATFCALAIAAALLVLPTLTPAQDNIPDLRDLALPSVAKSGGWRGFLLFGGTYLDLKSNTVKGVGPLDVGNEVNADNTLPPEGNSDGTPFVTGEISYTFGESRWQLFLGTAAEDLVEFDLAQQFGFRKQWDSAGVLTLALLSQGLATEMWVDPFLENQLRSTTDMTRQGFRLQWDRIGGSGFGILLQGRKVELDDELSGASQDLTPAEMSLLDRNGDQSRFELNYAHQFGAKHLFQAAISMTDDNLDGEAVQSRRATLRLQYSRMARKLSFFAVGRVFSSEFEERNPVYNEYADATGFGAGVTLFYTLPTKSRNWGYMASLQYAEADSDIDFYDVAFSGFVTGITWKFGKANG